MPEYHRANLPGGVFFFTVVTYHRQPLFSNDKARRILHTAWENTSNRFPFTTEALCLLPDHIHCIWRLPETDKNFSVRWKEIKRLFSMQYIREVGVLKEPNTSRIMRGETTLWQRRFWEHTIRDEKDYRVHFDYIHLNPVKHGLVQSARDWPWSTFHKYVREGFYEPGWGGSILKIETMKFGE